MSEHRPTLPATVSDLCVRLNAYSFLVGSEDEFQAAVARALRREGVLFEREHVVAGIGRLDFWLPTWQAALELKVDGSPSEVRRQLQRYAAAPSVQAVVLLTLRPHLAVGLPARLAGKPVYLVTASRGGLQ